MKNTIKDFDLNLKSTKNEDASPSVGSRYLCTPELESVDFATLDYTPYNFYIYILKNR